MRERFWHERWQQNQIGFHQQDINPYLQQYWAELHVPVGSQVFVPLCGKSLDMVWLRAQGYQVLGVELSPIAVQGFFAENGLQPSVTPSGAFERWEADGVVILLGDFFQLRSADLAGCAAMYDRASMIALPPDMRIRYVGHVLSILPPACKTLLVTLDYDQSLAGGPPFAVSVAEVQHHYAGHYPIRHVGTVDVSDEMSSLRNKGVTQLEDQVFIVG